MCECGCGELRPLAKLPGPDGWWAIEVYPGCEDCGNHEWVLSVTLIPKRSEDAKYLLGHLKPPKLDKRGQWHQVILDAAVLREKFAENAVGGDDRDSDAMFSIDEFIGRELPGLLHASITKSQTSLLHRGGTDHG